MAENFDQNVLEKALKRKVAESGDIGAAGPSKSQWTHEDIDAAQKTLGLGDAKTLKLAHLIRTKEQRRDAVESNVAKHLIEKKKLLSDYYVNEKIPYQFGKKEEDMKIVEVETVYCNDIRGLIRHVCVLREMDYETVQKKVGIDSGKGKIIFNPTSSLDFTQLS